MEDLPALVFSLIFECHLSLKEQVRCTQVCRKWRAILDPFKRKRLFLHVGPFPRRKRSCTNEIIRFQDSFEIKSIDFLRHPLTRSYFKRIKQLTVFNIYYDSNQIEIPKTLSKYLYYFQELECLELEGFSLANKSQLSLKNLKTLSLKNCQIQKPLELNLPNLQHFISWLVLSNNITFKHPNSIRSMQYYNHHRDCRFKATFENLEVITIFDVNGYLLKNFLSRMPKLQRLILYSQMTENDFEELKRQRSEIFNLKDLQIHHFGYDESDGYQRKCRLNKKFNDMLNQDELSTVVAHLDQLMDNSPWPIYIDFDSLSHAFEFAIPERFFEKFINFHQVYLCCLDLSDATIRQNVMRFLTKSGFLNYLTIDNCSIDQIFLDQLHVSCSLINLEFIEQHDLGKLNLDVLSQPVHIKMRHSFEVPVHLIGCLFENLHFKSIEFSYILRRAIMCSNYGIDIPESLTFSITFDRKKNLIRLLINQDGEKERKFKDLNNFIGFLKNNHITKGYFLF